MLRELKRDQAVHRGNLPGIFAPEPLLSVVSSRKPSAVRKEEGRRDEARI